MWLRGDFHVHALGHGPLPESAENLNYQGLNAEPRPESWIPPSPNEAAAKVRAMIQAAQAKGLDFYAATDHAVNTWPIARQIVEEEARGLIVIPGFEGHPASADPYHDHALLLGVEHFPGEVAANATLFEMKRLTLRSHGLLVAAHPASSLFWTRGAIRGLWDAYEAHNCGFGDAEWDHGEALPRFADSDAHDAKSLLERPCSTLVDADEASMRGIFEAVRAGRVRSEVRRHE